MNEAIKVGLFDSTFVGNPSASLGGDNLGKCPKYIEWVRDEYLPITFFTDIRLDAIKEAPPDIRRVIWLIEPEDFSDTAYVSAYNLRDQFDYILSFHIEYVLKFSNGLWYPFGGSWVESAPKSGEQKLLSMITTQKTRTNGHMMRQQVYQALKSAKLPIDFYGRGSNPMKSKTTALNSYLYSIVIESGRSPFYFTEKLLDCFTMGTVPIYWGAPNISIFFDPHGIIQFDTIDDLYSVIRYLEANFDADYRARTKAISHNYFAAMEYECVEDWLFQHYPWLFQADEEAHDRNLRSA